MQSERLRQAKVRIAKYCAFAERSPKQVREKLSKFGITGPSAEEIVRELQEEKFIDAERFARAFCNDKFEFNNWGRKKIELELRKHDIENHWIEIGLSSIDDALYHNKIAGLLERKWQSLRAEDDFLKRKKKTIDYVIRKGFEAGLVFERFSASIAKG